MAEHTDQTDTAPATSTKPADTTKAKPPTKTELAEIAKRDEERGYRDAQWKGLPNYRCLLCPWDTLEEPLMVAHQAEHAPRQAPRRVSRALMDRFGNPVTVPAQED